jgi:hypothetical protein
MRFLKSQWQEKSLDNFLQRAFLGSHSRLIGTKKQIGTDDVFKWAELGGFPEGMLFFLINSHPDLPTLQLRSIIFEKPRVDGDVAYILPDTIQRKMWVYHNNMQPHELTFYRCASRKREGCKQGFLASKPPLTECPICYGNLSQRMSKAIYDPGYATPMSTMRHSGEKLGTDCDVEEY